jgi:uncharacterized PurR-regulated membrane protein YhhQ (DUF165 family)
MLSIYRSPNSIIKGSAVGVLYVVVALLVNKTISWWPPQRVLGLEMPPGLLLVGALFVMRDYAQQALGSLVVLLTLFAAALTYLLIGEQIGIASGLAFALSEMIDWAVFKITKRELRDRILISSFIAIPFDGLIFLGYMNWMDWRHFWSQEIFWVHYGLKMIASIAMWLWLTNRFNNTTAIPAE